MLGYIVRGGHYTLGCIVRGDNIRGNNIYMYYDTGVFVDDNKVLSWGWVSLCRYCGKFLHITKGQRLQLCLYTFLCSSGLSLCAFACLCGKKRRAQGYKARTKKRLKLSTIPTQRHPGPRENVIVINCRSIHLHINSLVI